MAYIPTLQKYPPQQNVFFLKNKDYTFHGGVF